MNSNKKASIIYIFLILQPIIDLLTSSMVRFTDSSITIGMITRSLFLIFVFLDFLFFTKSKYKKKSLIYFIIMFIFVVLYFITKPDIFQKGYLITEFTYLFKYLYFPIITICLINIFDKLKIRKEKIFKIYSLNLIIYALLIIVPEITGTAFPSYQSGNQGTVGWFYAANEIGAITVALLPYLYYLLFRRIKLITTIILFTIVIISMTLLGTKTAFLGMLITEILFLIYFAFNRKQNRGYAFKASLILIILSFVLIPNIPAVSNLQNAISKANNAKKEIEEIDNDNKRNNYKIDVNIAKIASLAFNGREVFLFRTINIYDNSKTADKFFGTGFVNRPSINDKKIEKLIEIDTFDILFHYGIIGFLIYFVPLLYIIVKIISTIIKRNFELTFFKLTNIYAVGIVTLIAMIAGHVYGAPAVSIYVAVGIAMINNSLSNQKSQKEKTEKKKITILALHLGFGGIEKYISSLCKMLEKNYEVEVISTYKELEKPAFEFSNNIKITYLINDKTNKKEFIEAIKNKNILAIIKEGIKSARILYLKRQRNIKSIRNIHSDYIITTRSYHSKLVGYYAYNKIIKIATEHNYHNNNKKYITKVINSVKGFEYFILVSKELQKFYSEIVKDTKCVYIPNVIEDIPKYQKHNKINNKIISVGRLSEEKGYSDLIDVIEIIKKDKKNICLDIYGDGKKKEELIELIKTKKLKENINICGFTPQEEIYNKMKKYDLYVMSSISESFGLVLIEAMSHSLPCIAFDSAAGAREILAKNNGILIKNRNKKEMAKQIIEYLNDLNKLNKLSETGYNKSKEFFIKNVQEQWLSILK